MTLRKLCLAASLVVGLTQLPGIALAEEDGQQAATADQTSVRAAALDLARLVLPSLDEEVQVAREAFEKGFDQSEDSAEIRAKYPGLMGGMWTVLEPEFRAASIKDRPQYESRLADLYARMLSRSEIDAFRRFFQTATGRKMIKGSYRISNYDQIVTEAVQEKPISESAVDAARERVQAEIRASATAEDRVALVELGQAMSVARVNAFSAEMRKFMVEWMNRPDPEFDARIGKLIDAFVAKYFKEHPPKD